MTTPAPARTATKTAPTTRGCVVADDTEALADLIADARDQYPRLADDMDSGELAETILASSWLAARDAAVVERATEAALGPVEALLRGQWVTSDYMGTDPLGKIAAAVARGRRAAGDPS